MPPGMTEVSSLLGVGIMGRLTVLMMSVVLIPIAIAADIEWRARFIVPDNLRLSYGNLNNQRIAFYSAVIASKHLKATLVLPEWKVQHGQYVPFQHLWDPGHLLKYAASEGVSILFPSALESGKMCSQNPDRKDLTIRLAQFEAGASDTLCVTSMELFFQLWKFDLTEKEIGYVDPLMMHKIVAESTNFAGARLLLKPSLRFAKRAYKIVKQLLPTGEKFYAVHVRTEEDFHYACDGWSVRIDGLKCMITVQEIAEQLEKHGIKQNSALYIFPWQSSEAVSKLCRWKYRCIHRNDVDPANDLAYNEKALLDFAIAKRSAGAFGNIYSTMSVELVAALEAEAKVAAFLNTPCPGEYVAFSGAKCP